MREGLVRWTTAPVAESDLRTKTDTHHLSTTHSRLPLFLSQYCWSRHSAWAWMAATPIIPEAPGAPGYCAISTWLLHTPLTPGMAVPQASQWTNWKAKHVHSSRSGQQLACLPADGIHPHCGRVAPFFPVGLKAGGILGGCRSPCYCYWKRAFRSVESTLYGWKTQMPSKWIILSCCNQS